MYTQAVASGKPIDMENYFSRLALDIIGKAVFNYEFDSLTHDDPVIQVIVQHDSDHHVDGDPRPEVSDCLIVQQ